MQAASNFISTAVQINEYLSIATFNGSLTLNAPLTQIKDQRTRDYLISTLPTTAGGTSNIGQGNQNFIIHSNNFISIQYHQIVLFSLLFDQMRIQKVSWYLLRKWEDYGVFQLSILRRASNSGG